MKIQTSIFLFTIILLLGQSCGRTLYIPNAHNVPLLKEKNEVRSTISLSSFQASYALTDKIGVMVNGQFVKTKDSHRYNDRPRGSRFGQDNNSERDFIEVGFGYYKPLDNNAVFEIYSGAGRGNLLFNNADRVGQDRFQTKFSRYFIQPSIGVSFKAVDFSYSFRFVNLQFHNSDTSEYVYQKGKDLSDLENHYYFYGESGLTLRIGWKYVKFSIQTVSVKQLGGPSLKASKANLHLGLHINIANRFVNKKKIEILD